MAREFKARIACIVFFSATGLMLAGCQPAADGSDPALGDQPVAGAPLGPVNLLLNSGAIVDYRTAYELKHLQDEFRSAGLFSQVEIGIGPFPVSLRADYDMDCPLNVGETLGGVAAAGSMFVIPHPETCNFKLDTRFYAGATLLAARRYTVQYTKIIEFFGHDQATEDEKGIDLVFAKMAADLRANPPPGMNARPGSGVGGAGRTPI